MKKVVIGLALIVLTGCAPRYIFAPSDEMKQMIKATRELLPHLYKISPTGRADFQDGYYYWNADGFGYFLKRK